MFFYCYTILEIFFRDILWKVFSVLSSTQSKWRFAWTFVKNIDPWQENGIEKNTSVFCIRTMHFLSTREFSTTPKTLWFSQCTCLRRQTVTSFLLGRPRNHPKGHYFETIDNTQNTVTESFEEENSRFTPERRRSREFREEFIFEETIEIASRSEIHVHTSETVKEDPKKIKQIIILFIFPFSLLLL